jgi:molybdopterin-guanine dinucleotide biosynthesis adapter protein
MDSKQVQANIISIAGQSGSGKTTFLEKLIPHLSKKGYRIGVIKHAHCKVEMEKKGKDSWRHKNAGAAATLVISPNLISMVKDYKEPDFVEELIDSKKENFNYYESLLIENARNYLFDMDIIIVEGFKYAPIPKFEIFRVAAGHDKPLFLDDKNFLYDKNLVGFITDSDYRVNVPCFGLDDTKLVADFIEKQYL